MKFEKYFGETTWECFPSIVRALDREQSICIAGGGGSIDVALALVRRAVQTGARVHVVEPMSAGTYWLPFLSESITAEGMAGFHGCGDSTIDPEYLWLDIMSALGELLPNATPFALFGAYLRLGLDGGRDQWHYVHTDAFDVEQGGER